MEISSFCVSDTASIAVISPATGEATDFIIEIHGLYSDKFRPAFVEFLKRVPGGKITDIDDEFLVDMTESWEGATSKGKPFKFNRKNALGLYGSSKPIRSQLIGAILKGSDFLANA